MHHPDRARADNQDNLSGADVECILSPEDTGKGFQQGSNGRIHRLADRDDISLPDRAGRNEHVLSEAAIASDAKGIILGTQVVVACDTLATVTTTSIGPTEHALTNHMALDIRAHLSDRAHNFVARDADRSGWIQAMIAVEYAQIGATNARARDLDQQITIPNVGNGHVFHPQIVWAVVDGC
jgi:hypothetical protein